MSTKPDYDLIYKADRVDENTEATFSALSQAGVEAMRNKNYQVAEGIFSDLLHRNPNNADANFLMGLAKIGLEKWAEAKGFLETAVKQDPKRPEPRTRLGLTYIQLEDNDSARKQRAELARMDLDCKGACDDAVWIADGLVLLDQALSPGGSVAAASSAPSPAAASASAIPGSKELDPANYSLVTFDDPRDLYKLLTEEGRCPPNKLAEPKQPCALILYTRVSDVGDGHQSNFKPVFKVVSKDKIWAIHDKKLQSVRIENLYHDEEEIIGKKKSSYRSIALIGNAENKTNCEQARPCLASLVSEDMFRMYSNMPDSVVEVIWGPAGMKDPGTVRIR
ncbi:MAG: tetratricopeptide repeat protein [Hyphomonadaceae bacterium]|nr:tetratricopeptide repeat protein [Hyphomonadaceae bacterium]